MTFRLESCERAVLERLLHSSRDNRALRRIKALLDLDAGHSPALVARWHRVSRSTIYNWMLRSRIGGLSEASMRDRPRPGRPRRSGPKDEVLDRWLET